MPQLQPKIFILVKMLHRVMKSFASDIFQDIPPSFSVILCIYITIFMNKLTYDETSSDNKIILAANLYMGSIQPVVFVMINSFMITMGFLGRIFIVVCSCLLISRLRLPWQLTSLKLTTRLNEPFPGQWHRLAATPSIILRVSLWVMGVYILFQTILLHPPITVRSFNECY